MLDWLVFSNASVSEGIGQTEMGDDERYRYLRIEEVSHGCKAGAQPDAEREGTGEGIGA